MFNRTGDNNMKDYKINDKIKLDNKVYVVVGFKAVNRQTQVIVREA